MRATILLVEDNDDDATLTRLALERFSRDLAVDHVTDGAQALAYLADAGRAARVAFVILDIKMPKVDGIEVLEKLKADPATRAIPVVMLTSSSHEVEIARCFDLGANSFVVKPVEFEAYLDTVSTLARYWRDINRPPPAR